MKVGKTAGDYLAQLWDNVTSVRGVSPIERRLQKIGAITLRSPSSALGRLGYVARQITDKGRDMRGEYVIAVAASLSGTLSDVLEEASARPVVGLPGGALKLRLSQQRARAMHLVTLSRANGERLCLVLTPFGRAVRNVIVNALREDALNLDRDADDDTFTRDVGDNG